MKHLTTYLGLVVLLTIFGCAQNSDSTSVKKADEKEVAPTTEQKTSETFERKLIKEGQVEFETDNLNSTRKTIFEAVNKYKGYVSSDKGFKSPGRKSNTVIIRVPADNFDNLLSDATQGIDKFVAISVGPCHPFRSNGATLKDRTMIHFFC